MKCNKAVLTLLILVFTCMCVSTTYAISVKDNYIVEKNTDTEYVGILMDPANILTSDEEASVFENMYPITEYANVIFAGVDKVHTGNVVDYAKDTLESVCAAANLDGYYTIIFMIDMYNRELTVYVGEYVPYILNEATANSITDNVYEYAIDGNFAKCASKAYEQIYRLLDGQKIAQPMRFISAGLLAIFVGLTIAFLTVRNKTKRKETTINQALLVNKVITTVKKTLIKESERPYERPTTYYSGGRGFGSSYSSHSSYGSSSHSWSSGGSSSSWSSGRSSSFSSHSHSSGSSRSSGSSGSGRGGSHRF